MKRQTGTHLIGTLIHCDKFIMNDPYQLYNFLCNFPAKIGMRIIGESENPILLSCKGDDIDDLNIGYTGIGVFYESHFSFHAWPEYECSLDFDIFSCKAFDPEFALKEIRDFFQGYPVGCVVLERGHYGAKILAFEDIE